MDFSRPITEIIRARSSRRRYQERPIDEAKRAALAGFVAEGLPTPFGSPVRLALVAATERDRLALKGLGTYGMIRGAPGFIVGAVKPAWKDMEDYGYALERAILVATDLGLGTCWLGGTFTRSAFARAIGAAPGETVPAVAAVGHHTDRRGAVEEVVRWGAKSARRNLWGEMFFAGSFASPLAPGEAGPIETALEMTRLAPSASNKQPWRVVVEPGSATAHFFVQRDPAYSRTLAVASLADLQRIDLGIAMCHFELTARATGGPGGAWAADAPQVGPLPELTEYVATWRA
jgi:nitroreductase